MDDFSEVLCNCVELFRCLTWTLFRVDKVNQHRRDVA